MKTITMNQIAAAAMLFCTTANAAKKIKCNFDNTPGKYLTIKSTVDLDPNGEGIGAKDYPVTLYLSDKPGKNSHETISVESFSTRVGNTVDYQIKLGDNDTLSLLAETGDGESYGASFSGTYTVGNLQESLTCK